ncbi:hypothetical protein [Spelaeicoccus albus]|uniref:YtxH-like protein n=1 Tax=Spelaeicoccus albus TaxID=1280376 RepID=A0A7Z0D4B1_9MICO|nr:hypothetical protein [Spelaeicoccus albus]NYI68623.1 hypothetical protein [Spelaeicoccus albus]
MKRLVWVSLGVAVGVVAVQQIAKRTRIFSPDGGLPSKDEMARSLSELATSVGDGVRERKAELRSMWGSRD